MKFIKKNIKSLIAGTIALILLIIVIVVFVNVFMPNNGSQYGNRLDGMDKIAIKDDTYRLIVQKLKENEKVVSATSEENGRKASFIIDVEPGTDLVTVGTMADKIMENFTEEQKKYYDVQVFVTCSKDLESTIFPTVGYRHKTSGVFKWTNTK